MTKALDWYLRRDESVASECRHRQHLVVLNVESRPIELPVRLLSGDGSGRMAFEKHVSPVQKLSLICRSRKVIEEALANTPQHATAVEVLEINPYECRECPYWEGPAADA